MFIEKTRTAVRSLSIFRPLLAASPVAEALTLLDAAAAGDAAFGAECWARLYYALRTGGHTGLGGALFDALRYTKSPYPLALERGDADKWLESAARRDVETLVSLAALDWNRVADRLRARAGDDLLPVIEGLPRWKTGVGFDFDTLRTFYAERGCGIFAQYRAFLWDGGGLIPVSDPDCNGSDEMLGYELQRGQVLENTRALLAGRRVNNVLLYGDSGTGKSATVKSLLLAPGCEGLCMIELTHEGLGTLPTLLRTLRGRRQRFVLLIDDLTFVKDDRGYAALKSVLEGGLERQPENVAIYATSNRRHLVRQTFSDRAGDEVDRKESIAEATSLAERFGLRIPYLPLTRAEFLDLVERMADLRGIETDAELLRREAVKWEAAHPGRTPRTAKQFLLGFGV